jgi:hypothetical protein
MSWGEAAFDWVNPLKPADGPRQHTQEGMRMVGGCGTTLKSWSYDLFSVFEGSRQCLFVLPLDILHVMGINSLMTLVGLRNNEMFMPQSEGLPVKHAEKRAVRVPTQHLPKCRGNHVSL